ncbi:hypothetical protein A0J61_10049 [Choanephora cucurbitarum]|uniref:Uncharacterized protein n=1 Tax=Choanephora cucurbitarum TaxID=101091 RepID=A0A1C7MYN5_9FUNG|nr:hypothetical protein A0J61_10049 [Choanephora cucurbitarum]
MSLKKQILRQHAGGHRTYKTALLSSSTMNDTAEKTIISTPSSLSPSMEESLQDWLSKSLPSGFLLSDVCLCCQRDDCQHFKAIANTIYKLENDVHLAAEAQVAPKSVLEIANFVIGQGLLQNHEQTVAETNLLRAKFKQEVSNCFLRSATLAKKEAFQERINELEYSLSESKYLKTDCDKERDRLAWELQRTQKSLEDTAADLESCNSRYLQLSTELKSKTIEIERLRIYESMAIESDANEELLRAKIKNYAIIQVGDLEQELSASKKNEQSLESKYKKLEAKYNSVSAEFDKLKATQKEMGITDENQVNMTWLRESNQKLRKDVLKLTYALLSPNAASDLQVTNSNQNDLVELIKELASANNKLKSDLLDCSNLLMECKSDLYAKSNPDEEQEYDDDELKVERRRKSLFNHLQDTNYVDSPIPMSIPNTAPENLQNKQDETVLPQDRMTPLSESHNTSPVIHHHYHYYMKKKMMSEKRKIKRKRSSVIEAEEGLISITPSSSCSSAKMVPDLSPPFHQLYKQVTLVLQRLQQTDIRALNRRLRRTFDIVELSTMSNTMIENILADVNTLKSQFSWIEDKSVLKQEQWIHDVSIVEFFPITDLVQSMLKEIGQLRTTMNDLQLEYVKKIEEVDSRFEKELLEKQKVLQQQVQSKSKNHSKSTHPIHWLSSLFSRHRSKPTISQSPPPPPPRQERSNSALHGSFYTHFLNTNSNSNISIYSNPVHPYSKPILIQSGF